MGAETVNHESIYIILYIYYKKLKPSGAAAGISHHFLVSFVRCQATSSNGIDEFYKCGHP